MIKIFISHQRQDTQLAKEIGQHLIVKHKIDCYVDAIDPVNKTGEALAAHIRSELSQCTQLLAVVSEATKDSWWVPWEIGVATEKDFPLATFGKNIELPDYLKKWPYLRTVSDLDDYAESSRLASGKLITANMESDLSESLTNRHSVTEYFFKDLRRRLGQ